MKINTKEGMSVTMSFRVSQEMHKKIKMMSLINDETMQDFLTGLVKEKIKILDNNTNTHHGKPSKKSL